jgi:class 3 adenylate cyclase/predicted ATPase
MMCPQCGAVVASNKRFCGDCGTGLPWQCGACGSEHPADKRFCGDCGAVRGAVSQTPQALTTAPLPERRLLSVMMIDLVGSTALGQRLDPEDLREAISAFHAHVTSLVACFNGFIARYMGDGVLVYFGYPQADEADAERAIRAGLTIVDAVKRLNTTAGPPGTLNVRVGVDSGLVVVGDLIGFGSSRETAVVGDTPNLAARLQSAAEPGSVVISDATRLLVGNLFECRELILSDLKGRRAPERAWTVLGESVVDSRYQALRRGQLSLVNRTEELELLQRRWEQAKKGEGRVILLTGEPGIGKSRLVASLEQYAASTTHLCLHFLCSPHHLDTPLYPIIRHMERAAKFQRGDPPTAKWDKLSDALSPGVSLEDKALLADLLSIQHPSADALKSVAPQRRKSMIFAAILRQIGNLTWQRPTLAILEDIHWADPTTLDLLNVLVEAVQRLPLLLVVTARPEVRPAWASRPHVTVKVLGGLDDRLAASLIKQVAGGRELSPEVIDRIIAHADSVPLFIEELTKTVLARPVGHGGETLSPDVVPTSLYSSLMARLDRLVVGKEVARTGSVIGREFSFELIQAVSQLPAKTLEDALGELAQAEIIIAHGQPPLSSYTFKHALVQDAAYASLLRDQRRAIHRRLAEVLEKDVDETVEPQVIAWHFAEAALPEKSVDYYQKAAEHATGRFALAEIVHHLRNGLNQIKSIPDSADKQRRELALQLELGRALIDHEGADSEIVLTTFQRARELCLALDEIRLLPRIYDGLVVNHYFIRSQPEKIIQYTRDMIPVHQRTGDRQALFMQKRAESLANLLFGNFEAARQEMQSLVDLYDPQRDGPNAGMSTRDPIVSISVLLGICLTILGHIDSGAAMSSSAVQRAETLNHAVSLNLGLRRACAQAMLQKDVRRVTELADRMAALRTEYETYKGSWEGTFFHDWAQMCTRPDPVLFDRMQVFLRHLDATNNWALLPLYMVSTAELSCRSGDNATGAALLERAAEIVRLTGARWCEPEIARLRANCARDADEAISLLRLSQSLAREQGAKLWELRSATDLAKLMRVAGDQRGARDLLMPVYGWFTEGSETPDLVAAKALLDEISGP